MNVSKSKPAVLIVRAVVVAIFVAAGASLFLWHYAPLSLRKTIFRVISTTKWSEYERLTRLLSLGMSPSEVEQILNKPAHVDILSLGQRWIYGEDDSTAGWTCVAEFKRDQSGKLSLCYIVNIQHRAFRDSPRSELGNWLVLEKPEGTILLGYPPASKQSKGTPNTNESSMPR